MYTYFDETDEDDVNALAAEIRRAQTHAIGYIRWKCEGDPELELQNTSAERSSRAGHGVAVAERSRGSCSAALLRRRK
jgi:hypothetical protein